MNFFSKNRVAFSLIVAAILLTFAVGSIFWARGWKPNFKNRSIDRTGLLVVTSIPTGAEVYLDDRLSSATDTTIAYLDPKSYKVRIQKEGYSTWEKEISIREDLSTEIKALLFPTAPEIKPLTTAGAANPLLSPDGGKIVYATPGERGGIYVLAMTDRPFPFRNDPRQIAKNTQAYDFSKSFFLWSPDSNQIIATFLDSTGNQTANILLEVNRSDQELRDITAGLNSTLNTWQQEINVKAQTQAVLAPDSVKSATEGAQAKNPSPSPKLPDASPATAQPSSTISPLASQINYYPNGLIFSPDEEKILYKNGEGKYKVFDLKTDKEYTLPELKDLTNISWFPDSNHFVIAQKDQVSIIEADGTNKVVVYSGKFENGFVFAHPSGQRIIILTSLTQPDGTLPNLYAINLR